MLDVATIPFLSILTFLPIVGALGVLLCSANDSLRQEDNIRHVALLFTGVTFLLSLVVWYQFDATSADFQFVEKAVWFERYNIAYHMGIDGISLFFVVLSAFLSMVCVLASGSIKTRVKEYMAAFLVLDGLMIGMFCALDTVLFYVFFEAVLIPMFLIIGIWGGKDKIYAAYKLFLYTLAGSLFMLVALLVLYHETGTTAIPQLLGGAGIEGSLQYWLWAAFFAAFAVKIPMVPFHTWLPDAHVQAPTAGSVILAGVLLKMGAYGFLRFSIPMFPEATVYFTPYVYTLSIVAVIYTSLIALVQKDMKKLIAYSSIAHMGFVTVGLFSLTEQGMQGAVLQMLSHGIVSGALFLCVGVLYDRLHTREISAYGGVVQKMPFYAAVFMIFTMASVGLPGTSGFVGEFLVLLGVFQVNTWVAALVGTGMILGACYALLLYRKVVFGPLEHESVSSLRDMNFREKAVLVPLVLITLWMGIYPSSFLEPMQPALANLIATHQYAMEGTQAATSLAAWQE